MKEGNTSTPYVLKKKFLNPTLFRLCLAPKKN